MDRRALHREVLVTVMRERLAIWWKRFVCSLDGHGGLTPVDGGREYRRGSYCLCKRCGSTLKLWG